MNLGDKLLLGANTTVIAMGIVFLVLFCLSILIKIQYSILKALGLISEKMDKPAQPAAGPVPSQVPAVSAVQEADKSGLTQGEARLVGVGDEELVAVIMAAVSQASSIPLSALKIRSIKRVDNNWPNTAKQEMANQRL